MTTIYGGSENGLLNSSFAIIGRGDQVGPGDPGHGERVYVNSVNGNLVIQHQDAYLPSFGADFQLVRTYNQRGLPVDPERDGKRWSMSTSVFLSELHDGPEVYYEVQYGDGSTFEYRRDVDLGLYVSTDGADSFETIEDLDVNGNTAPAFLLTRADQTVMAFNRHGDLISSVDPNGVRMDYFYQSNRLMTIQDDSGHQINYIYAQGKLERIEDETGAVLVQYGYQGGKLTEVTDRFGHTTTYHYSPQGELIRIELPYQQEVDGQTETYDRREIQFSYEAINWADSNSSGGANAGLNYVVSQITDAQGGVTTFQYEFNNVDLQDPTPGPGQGNNGHGQPDGVPPGPPNFAGGGNLHHSANAGNWISNEVVGGGVNRSGNSQGNAPDSQSNSPGGRNPRFNINGDPFTGGRTTITDAAGNTLIYEYDSEGQVTGVTDQLGYETQYAYDEQGNLTAIVDRNAWGATNSDAPHFRAVRASLGVVDMAGLGVLVADLSASDIELLLAAFTTTMTYDDRGNLLTTTDNDGFVTTYTYTQFNKIESLLSGVGHALLNSDEAFYQDKRVELGFPATVADLDQDPAARAALQALYTTTYEYDDNQNLVERRDPGGDITRFDYDANGNRTHQIVFLDASDLDDPDKQQITQYFYDGFGNNIETIDPEGNHTFGTYDHFGNLTSYTDGNGNITNYVYDADNRLLSVTNALQHTVVNTYDAVGNRTSITDENGNTVVRVYSQNNFLLGIFDPSDSDPAADRATAFTYDVVGNRTSTTDAEGRTTTYEYNERRELVLVTTAEVLGEDGDPAALVQYTTEYSYDGEGNRLSIRDRNDNLTQLLYTEGGLLEQRTDALGNVTQYVYDANNNQVQIIVGAQLPLARQQIVSFSFDEENQLVTRTDAENGERVFSYDAPGNVASITDENGNTTEYEYDANNRLILERSPEVYDPEADAMVQHEVVRRYDGNGNQIEIIDARNNSTKYTFDADNRLVMVEDGNQIKTVYSYDSRDNRTSIQIGVTATADADGLVTVTDVSSAQVTSYEYDEFNQLVAKTDGVGNALAASDLPFYQALRVELGYAALVADLTAAQAQELRESYTERYTYDRVGNNLTVTDNEDRTTVKQYDTLNRLIKELLPQARDADGNLLAQTSIERRYDGNGNLKTLIDQLGRASTYTYDANNRLVSSFDNRQVETLREYDEFGNLRFLTRAASYPTPPGVAGQARQTEYIYDLNNRLTDEIDPLGHRTITRYDAVGNRVEVERVQDAGDAPRVTEYMYDALNRNIKIIDPRSFETSFEYDGAGNRVSIIDARDGTQRFDFDGGNRQIRLTDAEGRVMEFDYDDRGNRIEVRTGVGTGDLQVTQFNYDAEGNLRSVLDDENGETTYGFDRVYNQTRATDANENVTTTAFDALNRAIVVTDALDGMRITQYDAVNNVVSRTDELGRETTYQYDAANRLTIETSPYIDPDSGLAVQTHYQYDEVGNRVSITRAANITGSASTTQFFYDLDDKLIQEIDPEGGVTSYAYDANHNVTAVTDANGHALVTSDDPIYRAMRLALNDLAPTGLTFDELVADLSEADKAALLDLRTTRYEYDQNNQLTRIVDPLGYDVQYAYDGNGNRTVVTDQRGNVSVTYYNANNEAALSVDAEGYATAFAYDANGNVTSRTLYANALSLPLDLPPAGAPGPLPALTADALRDQTILFVYDGLNRVTERTSGEGYRTQFVYDAVGNLTQTVLFLDLQDDQNVAITRTYYDELNRVASSMTAERYLVELTYDAVGNLKTQTTYENRADVPAPGDRPAPITSSRDRVETFNYDAANRLASRQSPLGAVQTYTYDARGNRLTETDAAIPGAPERTNIFRYDQADRLFEQVDANGTVTRLQLDAAGNVVVRSDAFGLAEQRDTQYGYDSNNRLTSQINPLGVGTLYVYDGAGNVTSQTDGINTLGLTGERTETLQYDGNNRLVMVVNGEGEISTLAYDAAGNEIAFVQAPGLDEMRVTQFTFDRDNRLAESIDAAGSVNRFQYDGAGNQLTLTEAFGVAGVERTTTYDYDLDNRLTKETSALGSVRRISYDVLGGAITSTDANGNVAVRTYDIEGRLLTATSAEGIRLTNVYDLRGNLLSATQGFVDPDPVLGLDERVTTYGYDVLDRQTLITDGEGFSTSITYDRFGNQTKIETGLYLVDLQDAAYSAQNAALAFPLVDTFTYDDFNQMTSVTDANGNQRQFEYDAVGNRVRTITWANGDASQQRISVSVFDLVNREIEVRGAGGGIVQKIYDEVGNLEEKRTLQSRDPDGIDPDVWIIQFFEYDGEGRQTASVDALGVRNEIEFDAVGNVVEIRRAVGSSTTQATTFTNVYDLDNRLIAEIDEENRRTDYTYDASGNRTSATDAMGNTGYYYFDRNNRQVAILDPEGYVNTFRYDAASNIIETRAYATPFVTLDPTQLPTPATSSLDRIIATSYDRANNLTMLLDADGTTTAYIHDSTGKLRTQTSFMNASVPQVQTFDYDLAGRLVAFTNVAEGTTTTLDYDGANNKTSETITRAGSGEPVRRTEFTYDKANRAITQTFINPGFDDIVQHTGYDRVGNIVSKTDANGGETITRYDLANRFIEIIDPTTQSVLIQYDDRGNQTSYTDANNRTIEFVYDKANRVIMQIQPEVMVYEFGFTDQVAMRPTITTVYDAIGNAIQTIDANGNRTTRYFDSNRNMVAEVKEIGANRNVLTEFTYNGTGKVLTETRYMLTVDDSAHATRPPAPGGVDDRVVIVRTYDLMDRLRTESYSGMSVSSLNLAGTGGDENPSLVTTDGTTLTRTKEYDAYGREVVNIDFNGNREVFYYDSQGRIAASVDALGYLTEFEYDAQGNVLRRLNYTQALTGPISPDTRPTGPGTPLESSFVYDAAGRTIEEFLPQVTNYTDGASDVANVERLRTTYTYDGAGNQLTRTRYAGTSDATTEYSYFDAANRLVALVDGNRTLHTYDRDGNGNITRQTRYITAVSTGVNLAILDGRTTNFAQLIVVDPNAPPPRDQITETEYDALGRVEARTDLMGPGTMDDLTVHSRYDASGNLTWRQDEDNFVSQRVYDGANRVIQTISPDGSGSEVEYDAMGNDVRLYTGDVFAQVREASIDGVSLEFVGGQLRVAWTGQAAVPLPGLGIDMLPTPQTKIVWDVDTGHADIDDYPPANVGLRDTSVNPSTFFDLPLAGLLPDQEIFFRIVSTDAGLNEAWTSEYRVLVPPKFTDLEVTQPAADSLTVSVRFEGTVVAPVLNFGTYPDNNQSIAMVLQGDGSYAATITGATDPQSLGFQVGWQDSDGNAFTGSVSRFEAETPKAGIRSLVTNNGGNRFDVSSRLDTAIANQFLTTILTEQNQMPVEVEVQQLRMQYRVAGSTGDYLETVANGTAQGGYVLFDFDATAGVSAGDYEVVIVGTLASGDDFIVDTFVTTFGDSAVVHEAMAWTLPEDASRIGNDQLVILDGLRADGVATRRGDGSLLIDLDETSPASQTYDVFYGTTLTVADYSVAVTQYYVTTQITDQDPSDNYDPVDNPSGDDFDAQFDYQVTSYELQVDATNVPAGAQVAWRQAGTGSEFANVELVGSRFAIPTPGDAARDFDIKVFYIDGNGNEVIVNWSRVTTTAGPAIGVVFQEAPAPGDNDESIFADTSDSIFTVLASETNASVTRNGSGIPGLERGLYVGALVAEDRYRTYSLNFDATANLGSTENFEPGETDGYFVLNRFDAMGHRTATNEGDGVWKEFALDGNGNTIATLRFVSEADAIEWRADMQNGPQPIVTYAEFDARGREVRTWSALIADPDGGMARAINSTTYDFANRVLTRTDARGKTQTNVYDELGRVTRETDKLGNHTDYRYDRFGNRVARIQDPDNADPELRRRTVWAYDGLDRMISETSVLGFKTTFGLDQFGRRISETREGLVDANDRTRTIEYDERDRVVRTVEHGNVPAQNRNTFFTYDGRNNRTGTIDARGGQWLQEYDAMGRVSATISFQGGLPVREARVFDYFGNLVSTTDAMGRTRSNEYGRFSRLISSTDESGRKTIYSYDHYGRQIGETESTSGKDITRAYDAEGRLTMIDDRGTGVTTTYTYDLNGNRLSETDTTDLDLVNPDSIQGIVYGYTGIHNRDVTYTYDAMGQVTAWADAVTGTHLNYMYDAFGNLKSSFTNANYTLPGGGVVNNVYNYDRDDRVTSINRGGTLLTYSYNEFNDRTQYYDGTNFYFYQYNKLDQVTEATYSATNTDNELENFRLNWFYDQVGNVTAYTERKVGSGNDPDVLLLTRNKFYFENNRNWLTIESRDDGDSGSQTFNFFDLSGRLLTEYLTNISDGGDETQSFTYRHTYARDGRELRIDATGDATGNSVFAYNTNDQTILVNQGTGDDLEGTAFKAFVHNNENRIVFRYTEDGEEDTPQPQRTQYLYALGKPVGDIDTSTDTDNVTTVTSTFDSGRYNLVQDIGADNPAASVTRVTASAGDTAQSIAAAVYGNPSLWFIIAEANGLAGDEMLSEGQQILVPNTVQTGTLTSGTQVVYSEGDIIGSTLPNLTSPPQSGVEKCLAILAIILVIIVAIVVTIVTVGVGSAIAAPLAAVATASLGAVLGTIATVVVLGVVGAAIAFVGAVITQGILIGLTDQKEFDWLSVASAVAGGFLAGAASGLGALISAGKIVGTVAVRLARVAQVALDTSAEVVSQVIADPPGEISSWASIAGAALGSSLGVIGDTFSGLAKNADDFVDSAADVGAAVNRLDASATYKLSQFKLFSEAADVQRAASISARKSVARVTALTAAANVATVWFGLLEKSQTPDADGNLPDLTAADFIGAAGLTLGIAANYGITSKFGDRLDSIAESRVNTLKERFRANPVRGRVKSVLSRASRATRLGIEREISGALFGVGFLGNTPGANFSVAVQGIPQILSNPFLPQDLPRITPDTGPGPGVPSSTDPFAGQAATTPLSDPGSTLLTQLPPPASLNPSAPPPASTVSDLGSAVGSGDLQGQIAAITQINTTGALPPAIGPAVTNGGASATPLTTTNGLNGSTIPAAASGNGNAAQQAATLAQQAVYGGTATTTPTNAIAPAPTRGPNGAGPLPQVDPVAFSNALVSQAEITTSIADHVNSIAATGNGIRSNDVFGDPGAATRNDRVLGSLGANGKLGVPLPPRQPGDAQTLALATPGVRSAGNSNSAAAPVSTAGAFALGAVSSTAAGAALGFASNTTTEQQYAAALSEVVTANRVATPASASGVSLLAAAAGSGVIQPASAVSGRAQALLLGTAAPWAYGQLSDANAAQGFGDRYNYLAGAGVGV